MTSNTDKINRFAWLLEDQVKAAMAGYGGLANLQVKVKPSRKYTKVNVGDSGRYMIENDTGNIYGIKGYGVVHRGHWYGTLDTIDEWDWQSYYPQRRTSNP